MSAQRRSSSRTILDKIKELKENSIISSENLVKLFPHLRFLSFLHTSSLFQTIFDQCLPNYHSLKCTKSLHLLLKIVYQTTLISLWRSRKVSVFFGNSMKTRISARWIPMNNAANISTSKNTTKERL